MENVLTSGRAFMRTSHVVLESAAARRAMLSEPQPVFFCVGRGEEDSALSLRVFDDEPSDLAAAAGAPVHEILDGSLSAAVALVLELNRPCEIIEHNDSVSLLTAERTIAFVPAETDDGPRTLRLFTNILAQIMYDLKQNAPPAHLVNSGASESNPGSGTRTTLGGSRRSMTKLFRRQMTKKLSRNLSRKQLQAGNDAALRAKGLPKGLENLDAILQPESPFRNEFRDFLKFAFAEENFAFYDAVENFSSESDAARIQAFSIIVSRFIEDGAEDQVNLPSHHSHALVDLNNSIKDGQVQDIVIDRHVFDSARTEIFNLMERNFLDPFISRMVERQVRDKQISEMTGVLSKIMVRGGLESYFELIRFFEKDLAKLVALSQFFNAIHEVLNKNAAEMRLCANRFPIERNSSGRVDLPKERSLDRVLFQLFSSINKRVLVLLELLKDIRGAVIMPLGALENHVRSTLTSIRETHRPSVNAINAARTKLRDAIEAENALYAEQNEILTAPQEQVRPRRLRLTGNNQAKNQEKNQEKQRIIAEKVSNAIRHRESMEAKLSEVENAESENMIMACNELESLALHRLSKQREIITQYALVERSSISRSEMFVQALLFSCTDMDPVAEVMDISRRLHRRTRNSRRIEDADIRMKLAGEEARER